MRASRGYSVTNSATLLGKYVDMMTKSPQFFDLAFNRFKGVEEVSKFLAIGDSIFIFTYTLLHCTNLDWTLTTLEKSCYFMLSTISVPDCASSLFLRASLSMKSKSKCSNSLLGEKAENGDCKGLLGHLRVSGHLILGKDEGLFGLLDPVDEGLL